MEKTIKSEEKIFSENEISDYIFGQKLSSENKERLMNGLKSTLIENLQLEDGTTRDGKIQLIRDKAGEIQVTLDLKQEKLEIPKKILNHQLTEQERNDLNNNKVVPLRISNNNNIFLKIDKELNKVVISTDREIGIPPVVGAYRLTERDLAALANKELLPTKVFKGEHGYFMANLRILDDGKGIEFSNIKDVSIHESKELIEKYNKEQNSALEKVVSTGQSIIENKKETKEIIDKTPEIEKQLDDAIKRQDFKEIRNIADNKNSISEKKIEQIAGDKSIPMEIKSKVFVSLKLDTEKYLTEKKDQEKKKNVFSKSKSMGLPKRNKGNQISI